MTLRIHLDDCTNQNGALRVIKRSHRQGVVQISDWMNGKPGTEHTCEVRKGEVMLMKPLTLHASRRTENSAPRRVIHIEVTDAKLPAGLRWNEAIALPKNQTIEKY